MSTIIDRQTIDFLLFDVLGVEDICGAGRFEDHDRESLSAVLDLAQRISEDHLWPHAVKSDTQEPELVDGDVRILPEAIDALGTLREAGFFSAHADYDDGGMQLPVSVNNACNGMFKGANCATHAYMSLTRAAANLLGAHGSEQQKRLFMAPMLDGRFFGTMCLSEPDAGSSVGDIQTRAEPIDGERYAIFGNKMWISAGDHNASENIVHLVLARLPDAPAGVKGISLFAVPKYRVGPDGSLGDKNGIAVAGLNHKMGYRGTSNCLLNFGEDGISEGTIVGEPNRGLSYMFHMMNEARINVGIGGAMLGSVGYRLSLEYAKERKQGRHLDNKDPASKPVVIVDHPDVKRMLLKQKAYTEGAIALCLYAGVVVDRIAVCTDDAERERLNDLLDVLTPMVKAWPSEYGLEANKLAIQILGGYGYTRDFPVERLYRDNRLNMIHEGTNGIQGLDLLGRKAVMNDGRALAVLISEISRSVDACSSEPELAAFAKELSGLLQTMEQRCAIARETLEKGQAEQALALATLVLDGFGHVVVGWLLLRLSMTAVHRLKTETDTDTASFLQGKVSACDYFFTYEIPVAKAWIQTSASDPSAVTAVAPDAL